MSTKQDRNPNDYRGCGGNLGSLRRVISLANGPGLVGSLLGGEERRTEDLTSRQREVLQLLAEGRSMKEIAGLLNVTHRTVAFHKYRMMERLKVKSTAELVQYAVRHHIV